MNKAAHNTLALAEIAPFFGLLHYGYDWTALLVGVVFGVHICDQVLRNKRKSG